jgi:hypothetical protein
MSKKVLGTKTVPVAGDTLIIKDSQDSDNLKEISFSNLGVAAVVITNTVGQMDTYTMYSDVGKTNVIGTFNVQNGSDGSGTSIPPYNLVNTYGLNDAVMNNGVICISLQSGNAGNVPTNITDSFWLVVGDAEKVLAYDQALSYVVGDQRLYNGKLYIASGAVAVGTAFAEGLGVGTWHQAGVNRPPKVTTFIVSGTFTPDPLAVATHVEVQAGGGSGGGSYPISGEYVMCGSGGNSGAYVKASIDTTPLTANNVAVTVGAGGDGVTGAAGKTGGESSFGSYVRVYGGKGGNSSYSSVRHVVVGGNPPSTAAPTLNGAKSIIDVKEGIGCGGWSSRVDTSIPSRIGGTAHGADAPFGLGGRDEGAVGGNGGQVSVPRAGSGYGGGGAGRASNCNSSISGYAGGDGHGGFVTVTEYF